MRNMIRPEINKLLRARGQAYIALTIAGAVRIARISKGEAYALTGGLAPGETIRVYTRTYDGGRTEVYFTDDLHGPPVR